MSVGCPSCEATIDARLPAGPGIVDETTVPTDDTNRLQGTDTTCRHCGHELTLYYY